VGNLLLSQENIDHHAQSVKIGFVLFDEIEP